MPAESTTKAGHTSTSGRHAGMDRWHLWPADPDGRTTIRTRSSIHNGFELWILDFSFGILFSSRRYTRPCHHKSVRRARPQKKQVVFPPFTDPGMVIQRIVAHTCISFDCTYLILCGCLSDVCQAFRRIHVISVAGGLSLAYRNLENIVAIDD